MDFEKRHNLYTAMPFKSTAISLLFTVFLGPIGLLYASLWGGCLLTVIGVVVVSAGYPWPIFLLWLICCMWGAVATQRHNDKLLKCLLALDKS